MDMRFFFEGMRDLELSASGFLAMLLDGSPQFRQAFLRAALANEEYADEAAWHVAIEVDNVDVSMSSPRLEVIVENKIQAGSIEPDQLVGYYERARKNLPADRAMVAVLLTPERVGAAEVTKVRAVLRPGDTVAHLSWERDAARCADSIPEGPARELAQSGLQAVLRVIDDRSGGLAQTDERLVVRQIAARLFEDLQAQRPGALPWRWGGRNAEWIHTRKTSPFRLYVSLEFPVGGPPEYDPLTEVADRRRTVTLRSSFSKGGLIKRTSELGRRWAAVGNDFDVPHVGVHRRSGPREPLERTEVFRGTSEEIADRLAAIGVAAVDALRAFGSGAAGER